MLFAVLYFGLSLFSFLVVLGGFYLTRPFAAIQEKSAARWFTLATLTAMVWLVATVLRLFTRGYLSVVLMERLSSLGVGLAVLFFTLTLMSLHPTLRRWVWPLLVVGVAYHLFVLGYVLSLPQELTTSDWGGFLWYYTRRPNPMWLKASWWVMTIGLFIVAGWLYLRVYGRVLRHRPWYIRWAVYGGLALFVILESMEALDLPPFANRPNILPTFFWMLYGLLAWGMLRTKYGVTAAFSPQGVFRRLEQGILVFNQQDRLVEWNPAAARLLDLKDTDRGLPLEALVERYPWLQRVQEVHQTFPRRVEWEKEKGQRLLLEVATSPITDEHGAPLGWILILRDVTEHHRMDTLIHFQAQREVLYRYLMALGIRPLSPQQVLEQGAAWIFQSLQGYGLKGLALYTPELDGKTWKRILALGVAGQESPATLTVPQSRRHLREQLNGATRFPLLYGERVFGQMWAKWTAETFLPMEETLTQAAEILAHLYAAKREEGRLRLLQQVYANMSDAVFLFDADFNLVEANPAARALCGEPQNVATVHFTELFQGATPEAIRAELNRQGYWQGKLILQRKGQEPRTVDAVVTLLRHPDRTPTLVLVARDVTEQEALQREIWRQRERLSHLLAMAHQALAAPLRVRDLFEAMVSTARATTGATHFALILLNEEGRLQDLLISGDLPPHLDWDTVHHWAQAALEPGGLLHRVLQRRRPVYLADAHRLPANDDERARFPWRSLVIVPLYRGNRRLGLLLMGSKQPHGFDRQSRKLLQGMAEILALGLHHVRLYESQEHLAQERLKAREREARLRYQQERFLANVSHELRTPLQAILGYLEWIRMSTTPQTRIQDIQEELDEINLAASHMLDLVTQLLDFQKREAQTRVLVRPFKVQDMLKELVPLVRPLMEHNENTLEVYVDPPDLDMRSDPNKITHILLNLLSNAAKFTHQGRVTLRITTEKDDQGEWVVMSVADTGIGIPADALEHIFEPFVQADESVAYRYGGTGLGLTLAREYARRLGGDITVESEVGKGSVFTVRLPRYFTEPEQTAAKAEQSKGEPSSARPYFT